MDRGRPVPKGCPRSAPEPGLGEGLAGPSRGSELVSRPPPPEWFLSSGRLERPLPASACSSPWSRGAAPSAWLPLQQVGCGPGLSGLSGGSGLLLAGRGLRARGRRLRRSPPTCLLLGAVGCCPRPRLLRRLETSSCKPRVFWCRSEVCQDSRGGSGWMRPLGLPLLEDSE